MTFISHLDDRAVLMVSGPEATVFLQGLITNDVGGLTEGKAMYAAFLTPQGKILFDFLVLLREGAFLLDCRADLADALAKRLLMHRLRSKVAIERRNDLIVIAGWNTARPASGSIADPRLNGLGWRAIMPSDALPKDADAPTAYLEHRLDCGVPDGTDFGQDRIFALDADLDELHGVSFEKGCYVGQELTARMKHRGTARKRVMPLETVDGSTLAPPDAPIASRAGEVGMLISTYGSRGFALLRLDRLADANPSELNVAGTLVRVTRPAWLSA
jgi:folate-binding protein YgfZ